MDDLGFYIPVIRERILKYRYQLERLEKEPKNSRASIKIKREREKGIGGMRSHPERWRGRGLAVDGEVFGVESEGYKRWEEMERSGILPRNRKRSGGPRSDRGGGWSNPTTSKVRTPLARALPRLGCAAPSTSKKHAWPSQLKVRAWLYIWKGKEMKGDGEERRNKMKFFFFLFLD